MDSVSHLFLYMSLKLIICEDFSVLKVIVINCFLIKCNY